MKREKEITLLKGNVPNKHNVTFTPEALENPRVLNPWGFSL